MEEDTCNTCRVMKYIDKYPHCVGCPVAQYCGTMVSTSRCCSSYNNVVEPIESTVISPAIIVNPQP